MVTVVKIKTKGGSPCKFSSLKLRIRAVEFKGVWRGERGGVEGRGARGEGGEVGLADSGGVDVASLSPKCAVFCCLSKPV